MAGKRRLVEMVRGIGLICLVAVVATAGVPCATEAGSTAGTGDPEAVQKRCFRCHAWKENQKVGKKAKVIPSIDVSDFRISVHSDLSCLSCHPDALRLPHDHQAEVTCTGCHSRHPAKVAHEVHLSVSCQACHLAGIDLARDKDSGLVTGRVKREGSQPSQVHQVVPVDCGRCHFVRNQLGVASIVLPAKGVLCMPCHAMQLHFPPQTPSLSPRYLYSVWEWWD